MNRDDNKINPSAPGDAGGKRPYVKPAMRHEKVFETMALACGKIGGSSGPCAASKKLS
jgi:hypothetical protein